MMSKTIGLLALTALAFSTSAFAGNQLITAVPAAGAEVFYQIESSGRKNIAATDSEVALVWETVKGGVAILNAAFKTHKDEAFTSPVRLSEATDGFNPVVSACGERFIAAWVEGESVRARVMTKRNLGIPITIAQGKINEITIACKDAKSSLIAWTARESRISRVHVAELRVRDRVLSVEKRTVVAPFDKFQLQSNPGVAFAKGRYIVTWHDRSTGTNLLYASSAKNLNSFANPVQINEWIKKSDEWGMGSSAVRNVIAVSKNDLVLVVWLDKRSSRSGYKIYAAFSEDGGQSWGNNYKIGDDFANDYPQWSLSLAADASGAAVTWMDARYDENTIWLADLHGITWDDEVDISSDGDKKPRSPIVTFGPAGVLHAAWIEDDSSKNSARIVYLTGFRK